MKADLHTHTSCSDGLLSPSALVDRARDQGVEMLSITDHDMVDAYAELTDASPMHLVPGIELSAQWRRRAIHIVGLNIDVDASSIKQMVVAQKSARQQRMQKIVQRLGKLGLDIDVDALLKRSASSMLGRPQLATYLVETGQVESEQKAFSKYLGQGKPGDVHSQWPEVAEAVSVIRDAGGVAVLAHPLKYRLTRTKLRELLQDFIEAGGTAMEVISGRQIPSDTRMLSTLCREFDLYASVGSDFHQPAPGCADLGQASGLDLDLKPVWSVFS